MAKFFYKMQNILNIKFKLEDQAKIAYGIARANLVKEEEKYEQLEHKKNSYEIKLKNAVMSTLNLLEIKNCENAVETLKYHMTIQRFAVKNAEQVLEVARIKLNEVMVERKIHEKLKENAFEDFKKEIAAEESKEVDELVSFKYNNSASDEEEDYGEKEKR